MLITIIAFIVTLLIVVIIHELGHFLVARACGVKVLRFSFGFGKPLFGCRWGETEWVICSIPLGGYVKMLDEREEPVASEERHRSFNRQPVLKRIFIVLAGPVANFMLAVLLYAFVLHQGENQLYPIVGMVIPNTPVAQATIQPGDRIVMVDGKSVKNWQDIWRALMDSDNSRIPVLIDRSGVLLKPVVINANELSKGDIRTAVSQLGWMPIPFALVVGTVEAGSVAERAGICKGDRLLAIDDQVHNNWVDWARIIQNSPGKDVTLRLERSGEILNVPLRIASHADKEGVVVGRLGLTPILDSSWQKKLSYVERYGFPQSFWEAALRTGRTAWVSVRFIGKMLTGQASVDNLSGPLTIASVAGQTAQAGWRAYLDFLALISISIGIVNLLPIPVLDGGHLLYYFVEFIRGKPISEKIQALGYSIGFAVIMAIMVFALLNDVSRRFGG